MMENKMRIISQNVPNVITSNDLATVSFHGKDLTTIGVDSECYVAMKPIVEGVGLDWTGQQKKLVAQGNKFNYRHISIVAADGKRREMLCIPLAKLNGWLFSINPSKVKPEIRDAVTRYQDECFEVLYQHWMTRYQRPTQAPSNDPMLDYAKQNKELLGLFGITGNQATLALNNALSRRFDFNALETWGLTHLTAETQAPLLTVSELAIRLGIKRAQVNPTLIDAGFQTSHRDHKDRLCYELTEKGLKYGLYLDTNKKHSDGTPIRQIKWYASVIEVLKAHFEATQSRFF
jgi:hypothetical protein